jgi:hypothetical protein
MQDQELLGLHLWLDFNRCKKNTIWNNYIQKKYWIAELSLQMSSSIWYFSLLNYGSDKIETSSKLPCGISQNLQQLASGHPIIKN